MNKPEKSTKKNTTYRMEEEQIKQLDKLVDYYQNEFNFDEFNFKLSKVNVLERLIRKDYEQLIKEGKIKQEE